MAAVSLFWDTNMAAVTSCENTISGLQRVQNAAARLITNTRKYDHTIAVAALYNLYWLPVFYRIYFNILIITFKAIYDMPPSYISNLVS